MKTTTRIYQIAAVDAAPGTLPHMVDASTAAQALRHVTRAMFVIAVASTHDVIGHMKAGGTIETAAAETSTPNIIIDEPTISGLPDATHEIDGIAARPTVDIVKSAIIRNATTITAWNEASDENRLEMFEEELRVLRAEAQATSTEAPPAVIRRRTRATADA